ncbi:HET-domain-containing protein [Xylaria sp. FL0064]|nr:HET-domain-containing protein [Xylaria sp. FL0064]
MFEFEYEKIDITPGSDHICLLSLEASETFTDPIRVGLSDVKLTSLPCYEVLSYCWSDASDKCLISYDGRPFPVTRNLESALRHLRQRQGDRVLWIDAICIDQNNPAERSHQQSSESASTENSNGQMDNGATPSEAAEKEDDEMQDPTQEELAACLQLISRPWFSRCWVIQEASLARDVLVICGTSSLKWESFYWGFMFIMLFGGGFAGRPGSISETNLNLMTTMRQRLHHANGSNQVYYVDLLHLLRRTRQLNATDLRDKVYSVLGLIDPKEAQVKELTPNYTISVEECYKRAALAIMSYTRNLDVLATDWNPKSKLNLPSWAPDWEHTTSSTTAASIIRDGDREGARNPRYKRFCASSSYHVDTAVRVYGDVLTLSGYVFDTIVALQDTLTTPKWDQLDVTNITSISTFVSFVKRLFCGLGTDHDTLVKWDRFALSPNYSNYPTGEDPETVFAMTMCAGNVDGPEAALAGFRQWHKILRGPKAIYKSLVGVAAMISGKYYGNAKIYLTAAERTLYRRLERTEKGYLALVPSRSAVGDQISLFRGGKVPFVIRSILHENTYKLIGSSYVHGIMYGEAWDDALTEDISIA